MAAKTRKRTATTIEAILKAMIANGPNKQMKVADVIAVTKRPALSVYSVIYLEAKKPKPRVALVSKGTFKLTAAGKEATR